MWRYLVCALILLVPCYGQCPGDRRLEVYRQERTTLKYLCQRALPAMSEMSLCFWANLGKDDDNRRDDYFVSVARPDSKWGNEFVIGWDGSSVMTIGIQNSFHKIPLNSAYNMEKLWTGWHRHCFTWKASGQAKWYADVNGGGFVNLVGSGGVPSKTVRSGGFLALMQEQDSFNGKYDGRQTTVGQIAAFNMWNTEMSVEELNTDACGGRGNVVSWDTLSERGTATRSEHKFPRCDDRILEVYHQERSISKHLYQSGLPAMSQMSLCFWANLAGDDDNRRDDYLVSIARSGSKWGNEFLIGWSGSSVMSLGVQNSFLKIPLNSRYNMEKLWADWRKHCFTWKASGYVKWYADVYADGHVREIGSAKVSSRTVRSGGFLALMQDQDSVDGGYDLSQTSFGQLAEFNMWNTEMSLEQLNTNTCGTKGNVVSWSTLKEKGKSTRSHNEFPRCGGFKTLRVYHQERSISKYLYHSGLPAMSQMSLCFWSKLKAERRDDYLVSIARSDSKWGNEFLIGWSGSGVMQLGVQNSFVNIPLKSGYNMGTLWANWHKHCFTWKASGSVKWYADVDSNGLVQLVGSAGMHPKTVRSSGFLALMQDQDSRDGGYNVHQTTVGQLAEFNMWNTEMSLEQLNTKTCGTKGSVVSWDALKEKGKATKSVESFPGCNAFGLRTLQVHHQERSISKYLYQSGLPAMSQMSFCFWTKLGVDDDKRRDDYLVSIATSDSKWGNEFLLGWSGSAVMSLGIQNSFVKIPLKSADNMETLWANWHKHCFTWKASGSVKWYADVDSNGVIELVGSASVPSKTVRSNGFLALMQDQDSRDGKYDVRQTTFGLLAEFNMWNTEMSLEQLHAKTCGTKGNVVSWSTLKERGTSTRSMKSVFPECNDA